MTLAALIFDFDGTILDTEVPVYTSWKTEYERFGSDLPLDRWLQGVGSAGGPDHLSILAELSESAGLPFDRDLVAARRLATRNEMLAVSAPRPGIVELIEQARDSVIPLAVASSSSMPWVGGHLDGLGLRSHFDVVMTVDQVEHGKPAPDLFLAAARGLGVDPTRCVAIEDSAHGITSANAAGMVSIAVPNDITTHQDFPHAALKLASLADIGLAQVRALAAAAGTNSAR